MATYVVAAGFALWGKHKEVKAHNDYLDRLLSIKQNLAQERIDRMSALIPRLTSKKNMAGKLLQRYAELTIPTEVLNNDDVLKLKANQGNRILALYRSASYMLKLSNYIYSEATAWKNGQHTANTILPGYSDVIVEIDEWLYQSPRGSIVDSYYELAMDRYDQVLGKDLLLVGDPQSTSYALYNMDYVQIEPSNSPIGKLIASNPAIFEYKEKVGNVAEYISEHEKQPTIPTWLPVILSLIGLGIIWVLMNCNVGGGTVLSVLYLSGIWFTCFDYNSRLKQTFYYELNNLMVDGDEATKQAAGYVEQPQHNYEKKSFFKSLFD